MIKTKLLRSISEKTLFPLLKDSFIQPYHLLLFRISFAVLTGLALFLGDYFLTFIYLTAYQFVFLLDYVDGKIARYRNIFSEKWRRVDRTAHYLISSLFLLGITYSYFELSGNLFFLISGLIGSLSIILTLAIDSLILHKHLSFEKLKNVQDKRGVFKNFYSFLPIDGSFTIFYFLVIFRLENIAIIFLTVMYLLVLIKKSVTLSRWRKKKK